ncbi:hypothetical protein ACHAWO_004068 [Cyclotella atomus]|uniref:Peptidase S1 domain-containing protein n=1 Tax=Cyclotella atomus TaxID=382360 RepID=A0ABD3MYP5_9STRA
MKLSPLSIIAASSITVASGASIRGSSRHLSSAEVPHSSSVHKKRSSEQDVSEEPEMEVEVEEDGIRSPDLMQTRIIGGAATNSARFPYAVSIQDQIGHFCGGSLIAPDMVLTAAHCQGGSYDVVIGRHNLNSNSGESIPMEEEIPHPDYNDKITDSDWMLVKLKSPTTQKNIPLISLNYDANTPSSGQEVTVMGWGDTTADDLTQELAEQLLSVTVNVISNQQCDDSKGSIGGWSESYNGQITENMLCANDNGEDSCQGDSGGPLVLLGSDPNGADDIQVGVVSWGIGCASADFPGVYSRVSRATGWIKDTVCSKSSQPPAELCGGGGAASYQQGDDSTGTDDGDDAPGDDTAEDDAGYTDDSTDDYQDDNDDTQDDASFTDDYQDDNGDDGSTSAAGDDYQGDNGAAGDDYYDDDIYMYGDDGATDNGSQAAGDDYADDGGNGDNDDASTQWPTWAPVLDPNGSTNDNSQFGPTAPQGGSTGNWMTIVEDDFSSGFGSFNSGGADAKWLSEKKERTGVIDLQDGNGEASSIYSNSIYASYTDYRVVFDAYLLGMEDDKSFCFDISTDGGSQWTETQCWSGVDLISKVWHNDLTVDFTPGSNAIDLKVRFRCVGSGNQDDVLIDKIAIQGMS